ncbi:(+)-borneol dehydrogenase 1-like [Magnolia sinica]|uniref:(+)-borneol dehydrogenase 1-like n=1 Tax=Magnolia sinica TaxID=86752 RepID=UPI00265A3715|nr:(+)-borneol dehydrogenase 1-like [Magnolia sinica]
MSSPAPAVPKRLEGKVAIITGGASGIGESTARLFWANGAKVIIADIQDNLGNTICEQLGGENIAYVHCDVTDEEEVRNLVDFAVDKYGKLDIMYNNAGIMDPKTTSILTIEKSDLERVLRVNLVGSFLGTKHAARVMVPARKGCILFTGSSTASIACMNEHAYVASKRGIVGLAQNVTAELGQFGIRVNCVSPYAVATNFVKGALPDHDSEGFEKFMSQVGNLKGAVLKTDDVARAALYLASDDANYVSGLNLLVDGGFSIANPSVALAMTQQH